MVLNKKLLVLSPYYPSKAKPFEGVFIEQQIEGLKDVYEKIVVFKMLSLPSPLKRVFYKFLNNNKPTYIRNNILVVNFFYFDNYLINKLFNGRLNSLKFQLKLNYYLRGLNKYNYKNKLCQWILPTTYVFSFLNYKDSNVVSVIRGLDITILRDQFPKQFDIAVGLSDSIVANGNYIKEILKNKTETIYNIKDLSPFLNKDIKAFSLNQNSFIITHIGRFDDNKRQDLLIDLIFELKKIGINIQLNLIGNGEFFEKVKEYAVKRKVADAINFTGNIGHAEISKLLSLSDFYIHPSHREGIPNALVESMASGCICIARNVGGIPDIINSDNGFLFNEDNELFDLFLLILKNNRLMEIKHNARKHISEIFDNNRNKQLLVRLFEA